LLNEAIKQGINNLQGCPGPTTPRAIPEPTGDLKSPALLKARAPIKNRTPTYPQPLGHLSGTLPSLAPQQGLRTAQGFSIIRMGGYLLYYLPLSLGEIAHHFRGSFSLTPGTLLHDTYERII
jgi:hypothetical protein